MFPLLDKGIFYLRKKTWCSLRTEKIYIPLSLLIFTSSRLGRETASTFNEHLAAPTAVDIVKTVTPKGIFPKTKHSRLFLGNSKYILLETYFGGNSPD